MSDWDLRKLIGSEAARYVIVGVSSLAAYIGVNVVLATVLGVWPAVATGIAVCVCAALNFVGHARFTFRSKRPVQSSLPRYALLVLFNAGLAAGIVGIGAEILGIGVIAANSVSLAFVTVTTFFLLKHGVMSPPTPSAGGKTGPAGDQIKASS